MKGRNSDQPNGSPLMQELGVDEGAVRLDELIDRGFAGEVVNIALHDAHRVQLVPILQE